MKDLGIIRRMYFRDGLSLSEIERRTGLTRKTIRRWINEAEAREPKYKRPPAEDTKIAPFAAQIIKALEVDAHRPKRDRRTALKLFAEIKAAGFEGDYSRVTEFIRRWRIQVASPSSKPMCRCALSWAKPSSSTGAKSVCSLAGSGARSWRRT